MLENSKVNVKLSDMQLEKLKTALKDEAGTISLKISLKKRISWKMFDGNDLPHELLLTTRQKKAKKCI